MVKMLGLVKPSELRGPFSSPFELFPEELWRVIFRALKDPQDLLNVMYSSDQWYEMLAEERTIFLFPKVLEIVEARGLLSDEYEDLELLRLMQLMEYSDDEKGGRSWQRVRTEEEIGKARKAEDDYWEYCNNHEPFPPAIFQCRLVCKSWNRAVQNFLQFHPNNFSLDGLDNKKYHRGVGFYWEFQPAGIERLHLNLVVRTKDDIDEFLVYFEQSHPPPHCNPFIRKQLELILNQTRAEPELRLQHVQFLNTITDFLEKYGRHLYHISIRLEHNNLNPPVTYYPRLQRWLQLTPNLRTLRLNFQQTSYYTHHVSDGREEQVRLTAHIELTPLPQLEHLVLLQTYNIPAVICQHLLRRNGHIERLQNLESPTFPISAANRNYEYDTYFRHVTLNNLSELWIELRSRQELIQFEIALDATNRWPLKTLKIWGFNDKAYQEWPEWSRLFHVTEKNFRDTLTTFWTYLPKPENHFLQTNLPRESQDLRLSLPRVKQVRLHITCLASIDFLLTLKNSLEELSIHIPEIPMPAYYKSRERIKFNGMLDRMEESSIWKMLPKLRLLEVIVFNLVQYSNSGRRKLSPEIGPEPTKYLYEKHVRSGNVSKTMLKRADFLCNVIFSKSPRP